MTSVPELLELTRIQAGWDLFQASYVEAARALRRNPGQLADLWAERRRAVAVHPLSDDLRELYGAQTERSRAAIAEPAPPLLQSYAGKPVPLIEHSWLRSIPLRSSAVEAARVVLKELSLPDEDALATVSSPPGGGPAGRTAKTATGFRILATDDGTTSSLAVLLHELGHFLYEADPGPGPTEGIVHYVESEAAALALGRVGFDRYLAALPKPGESGRLWASYCATEAWLNHFYFLTEAAELGLCAPPPETLDMLYLRDTYSSTVGYQFVYAAASSLMADHPEQIVTQLAAASGPGRGRGHFALPGHPEFDRHTTAATPTQERR
ncbi:hypothetical protein [Streptomyces sp. NRRL F-2747]|uniref:hypothetical protein n=1 Tax=Streptomyces sp. NRRL F-2747 TaxID=1463843 RepID=UPI0004CA119A|nr:hypothetical protein [Streptomyces sp. NRRL F-2747]